MPETKKHILIVEDERALSHALDITLKKEGYDITIANDGEEGLRRIQEYPFDLVLLDLIMPRMDGLTLLKIAKEQGKSSASIPIMVLSNLGQTEDQKTAMALGAVQYLVKANSPFPKVLSTIKAVLNKVKI